MAAPSPSLTLGPIRLTVADLPRVAGFYQRAIGLAPLPAAPDGAVALGAPGGPPLVELVPDASAPPRAPRSSGLFHLALLVPDRRALARALLRVVAGGGALTGASDHLVSEALYLNDPEGNGIELYRDRPRAEWRRDATTGELAMATLPLDLDSLLAELPEAEREPRAAAGTAMPPGTTLGHVHLQVADLAAAEAFYAGALGFEVMVRGYPGALFVAADGYHHHLGLNTWASAGGPPAAAGARGLRDFAIRYASAAARDAVAARAADAGHAVRADGADRVATDPFGIAVRLAAPEG